jgi:hypothetical protein
MVKFPVSRIIAARSSSRLNIPPLGSEIQHYRGMREREIEKRLGDLTIFEFMRI